MRYLIDSAIIIAIMVAMPLVALATWGISDGIFSVIEVITK